MNKINQSRKGRPCRFPFDTMQFGDSFFTETTSGSISQSIRLWKKKTNNKDYAFVIRKVDKGVRIWRINPLDEAEIVIDKNVAIPRRTIGEGKYPFLKMEIGDSFYTETKDSTMKMTFSKWKQRTGNLHLKFITKKENNGTRVFRKA